MRETQCLARVSFVIAESGTALLGTCWVPKILSWTTPRTARGPQAPTCGVRSKHLPMTETPKRADRQDIARRVERGEKLLQKGKAAEALEGFLQTLAPDPRN